MLIGVRALRTELNVFQFLRWDATHNSIRFHVLRNDCPGADDRACAESYSVKDGHICPDPDVVLDDDLTDPAVDSREFRFVGV